MDTQLTEIREQQKATWNKFSPGWKKWDEFTMNFLKPMGDKIIEELQIQADDKVLDVACGTGEPGLTIASIARSGKVTGIDLAEDMLQIAKENAVAKQLSNYETQVCDVCELPFQSNSFDKISCRMGFMFFPDMQMASDEMYQVLKAGGRVATAVWSVPAKNNWITSIMSVISKTMQLQPPPPNAPGMFRCGAPDLIKSMLEKSGFVDVKEQEVNGKLLYDNFDSMWQMMNEVAAPVVAALSKADEATVEKIRNEIKEQSKQYTTARGIELDYGSLIISGSK